MQSSENIEWFKRLGASVHKKARFEKPTEYPMRALVPRVLVDWNMVFITYEPSYFVDPTVIANDNTIKPGGWADPEDLALVPKNFRSYCGEILVDDGGYPMNPKGRTGLRGRGLLGKWGANFAADPIITRLHPIEGYLELLIIKRKDNGQWALPGGMSEYGESVSATLRRELSEETNADLDMSDVPIVYRGYVDDPRNTDNAWMETLAAHKHLSEAEAAQLQLKAGSDAKAVRWARIDKELLSGLYANHADLVYEALKEFARVTEISSDIRPQIVALLR
jgi:ADP-ribose pyrophosphatase